MFQEALRTDFRKVVHAGYMVARVLGAAPVLADAIIDQLAAPSDKAKHAGVLLDVCCACL